MKYRSPFLAMLLLTLVAGGVQAQGMDLLKNLAGLGVSPTQALGGTKALLNVAKGNLGAEEFSQLLGGAPELAQIMEMSDAGSALGGLGGLGGESSDATAPSATAMPDVPDVGNLDALMGNADLISQFADLGMDAGMIAKFVPSLLGVAGGDGTLGLLQKGLGIL